MYIVDMYLRVRRACLVEGMSIREASRVFGLHRDTVRKMLSHPVPPGYRRKRPPHRPKLEPYTSVIDRILEDDLGAPKKQRHTAKRIFDRLKKEHGFDGGYTIVKNYVRSRRRWSTTIILADLIVAYHTCPIYWVHLTLRASEFEAEARYKIKPGLCGPIEEWKYQYSAPASWKTFCRMRATLGQKTPAPTEMSNMKSSFAIKLTSRNGAKNE